MTPGPTLRLLIIDDHAVVREALEAMLGADPLFQSIATAASTAEALPACENFRPDVVLLDLRMPGSDGFDALAIIHRRWPTIRVLVLSSGATADEMKLLQSDGASGYLCKSADRFALMAAIRTVAAGGTEFPPDGAPPFSEGSSCRPLEKIPRAGDSQMSAFT